MLPTLVNALAVIVGSSIGLLFYGRLSQRFRLILFQSIGLTVLMLGLRDALASQELPLLALGMILGGLLGEGLNLEQQLERLGAFLKNLFKQKDDSQFIDGFVYASILFCVGAMTVVGTFQAGVNHNGDVLYTKSILDGHAAIFLAGAMGGGVMASSLTILTLQGTLTLFFFLVGSTLPEYIITEAGAAGGLLIAGIAINLMELAKIRLGNLFPGIILVPLFVWLKHILFV